MNPDGIRKMKCVHWVGCWTRNFSDKSGPGCKISLISYITQFSILQGKSSISGKLENCTVSDITKNQNQHQEKLFKCWIIFLNFRLSSRPTPGTHLSKQVHVGRKNCTNYTLHKTQPQFVMNASKKVKTM